MLRVPSFTPAKLLYGDTTATCCLRFAPLLLSMLAGTAAVFRRKHSVSGLNGDAKSAADGGWDCEGDHPRAARDAELHLPPQLQHAPQRHAHLGRRP
eukprot:2353689-Rhodomonas_salina.3